MNRESRKALWTPSDNFISESNMVDYFYWIQKNFSYYFSDYNELWDWSVEAYGEFWESILEYLEVEYDGKYESATKGMIMPQVAWFEGIKLSYAEHVFRNKTDKLPAIIQKNESGEILEISWKELEYKVAVIKQILEQNNVKEGDSVVAYLPNVIETTVSFLSANSIGAIWSLVSPDFAANAVIERFDQIKPKILIAKTTYTYKGKIYNKSQEIKEIADKVKSIEKIIIIDESNSFYDNTKYILWNDIIKNQYQVSQLSFNRLNFSSPIWVLFSSGTTGIPKAITHSVGGILLEHLKYLHLHNNVKKGERYFWYTTTSWMMWNFLQSTMLLGAIPIIYDGNPNFPEEDSLWKMIDELKINHFGVGSNFLLKTCKTKVPIKNKYNLNSLISIGSTGSPLPPEVFDWVYKNIKRDVWLTSISGGTDICSVFVGGNPIKHVFSGEIQSITLGCDFAIFDEFGDEVFDEFGELVVKKPMPSMPIYFWNDFDYKKYNESYFSDYFNIWKQGDWAKITKSGGVIIYGRSDATLNKGGIRIGTSEIYRAVDLVEEVEDSLIISVEKPDGSAWMPIFLKLKLNIDLDNELIFKIKSTIKNQTSPRHVPDDFFKVKEIPYTISGKKMETPIKKIFLGKNIIDILKKDSMQNPESIENFIEIARINLIS